MSAVEINKLVAAVLVAVLLFMGISVGVDEILHEETVEVTVYPVPSDDDNPVVEEEPATETPSVAETQEEPASDLASLLAVADPKKGAKAIRKCSACHSVDSGGRNKVGPNLWGVVGAAMASKQGFVYSDAFSGLGGVWNYDELFAFLAKPKDYAPGTKMAFAGIKDAADLADLLAYLRTLSDNPLPLP